MADGSWVCEVHDACEMALGLQCSEAIPSQNDPDHDGNPSASSFTLPTGWQTCLLTISIEYGSSSGRTVIELGMLTTWRHTVPVQAKYEQLMQYKQPAEILHAKQLMPAGTDNLKLPCHT
jgi:hypothetical protein